MTPQIAIEADAPNPAGRAHNEYYWVASATAGHKKAVKALESDTTFKTTIGWHALKKFATQVISISTCCRMSFSRPLSIP
jgi:hypothetical protein